MQVGNLRYTVKKYFIQVIKIKWYISTVIYKNVSKTKKYVQPFVHMKIHAHIYEILQSIFNYIRTVHFLHEIQVAFGF